MTSQPAERVGLDDRGALRPGCRADILIFDPEQFRDQADYLAPARLATGLDYAIVNGTVAFHQGRIVRRRAEILHRGM
jgi:N-acyl-D-amino-acid deacylase